MKLSSEIISHIPTDPQVKQDIDKLIEYLDPFIPQHFRNWFCNSFTENPDQTKNWTREEMFNLMQKMSAEQEHNVRMDLMSEFMLIMEDMDEVLPDLDGKSAIKLTNIRSILYSLLNKVVKSDDEIAEEYPVSITETNYEADFLEITRRMILKSPYMIFVCHTDESPEDYFSSQYLDKMHQLEEQGYSTDQALQLIILENISSLTLDDWKALTEKLNQFTLEFFKGKLQRIKNQNSYLFKIAGSFFNQYFSDDQISDYSKTKNAVETLIEALSMVKSLDEIIPVAKKTNKSINTFEELFDILS